MKLSLLRLFFGTDRNVALDWASRPRQFKIQPRLGFGKDLRLRSSQPPASMRFFANDRRRTEKGREFKVEPSFIFSSTHSFFTSSSNSSLFSVQFHSFQSQTFG